MITCLLAALAFARLDAATPSRFNHDETKVGTYTLPDALQCEDGTRVTDPAAWQVKRRSEILRSFAATMPRVTPTTLRRTARRPPARVSAAQPSAVHVARSRARGESLIFAHQNFP